MNEDTVSVPDRDPQGTEASDPARSRSRLFVHLTWALVVLAALLSLVVISWNVSRTGERAVEAGLTEFGQLLAPRVEVTLADGLTALRGDQEAFLVAYTVGTTKHFRDQRDHYFPLGIPRGTSTVRVDYQYSVDPGVDLALERSLEVAVTCDESGGECTWVVPDPTSRPVAIDTSSIRFDGESTTLIGRTTELEHREQVLEELTQHAERDVRSPTFWQLHRENVRHGLEQFAENAIMGAFDTDEARPEIVVRFVSETLPIERN